jgi:plasmid stabilization system protein ParE
MRRAIVSPKAQEDLFEAWEFVAADKVSAADRLMGRIEDAIELLRRMPGAGHRRKDVRDPRYRCWPVRPYVIVYRYNDEALTVVRVLHGAMNFRKALKEGP